VVLAKTSNKLIRIGGFRIDYVDHAHMLVGVVFACIPMLNHHWVGAAFTPARVAFPVATGLIIVVGSFRALVGVLRRSQV
jgi:hypothetical protein